MKLELLVSFRNVHRVDICFQWNGHSPPREQWGVVLEKHKLQNHCRGQRELKTNFTSLYMNTSCLRTLTLCGCRSLLLHFYFAWLKPRSGASWWDFAWMILWVIVWLRDAYHHVFWFVKYCTTLCYYIHIINIVKLNIFGRETAINPWCLPCRVVELEKLALLPYYANRNLCDHVYSSINNSN